MCNTFSKINLCWVLGLFIHLTGCVISEDVPNQKDPQSKVDSLNSNRTHSVSPEVSINMPNMMLTVQSDSGTPAVGQPRTQVSYQTLVTWNPLDRHPSISLSDNLLVATIDSQHTGDSIRASAATSSVKWYWEVTVSSVQSAQSFNGIGVCDGELSLDFAPGYHGGVNYSRQGLIEYSTTDLSTLHGPSYEEGDTVGIALDPIAGYVWFIIKGQWVNGGHPELGEGGISLHHRARGPWFPCVTLSEGDRYVGNFGQSDWIYTPPVGFQIPTLQ